MGIVERKQRQRDTLRQQILDAALEVFATEGIQRVSMRRLAEKIEYSTSTIYMHFKSKDELFECVCEETFAQLAELFADIVDSNRSPLEVLQGCCRAYVQFGLDNPQQYTVAFLLDSQQRMAPDEIVDLVPLRVDDLSVFTHVPRLPPSFQQARERAQPNRRSVDRCPSQARRFDMGAALRDQRVVGD